MPDINPETGLTQAARLFSVLAEPARLRILQLLRDNPMCGCDLADDLNLTPATTCHHLEKLRVANLLSVRRSGRRVYYSMRDSELARAVTRSLATLENTAPDGEAPRRKQTRKKSGNTKPTAKAPLNGK